MLWPNGSAIRPKISSPFGPRSGGAFSVHYGADLIGYTTVRAAGTGRVTFAGWMNNAAGYTVVIDLGGGVTELHMHLRSIAVHRRQHVATGDELGRMGNSGNATGPCDHFEIRVHGTPVDPIPYVTARIPTPDPQEDDMPITILEKKDSNAAKSLYDVKAGRAIRAISKDENTAFRANPENVVYITVSDAEYAQRGGA